MKVESRADLSWTDEGEEQELSLSRTIRYESERE
jgi:hypothetical protein